MQESGRGMRAVLCRLCRRMNLDGVVIAAACFLCIGIFHPIVIKAEYYFSSRCWPVFLAVGVVALAASTQIENSIVSSVAGTFGCSCLWSIFELKEQEKRVERGWFPTNPRRKKYSKLSTLLLLISAHVWVGDSFRRDLPVRTASRKLGTSSLCGYQRQIAYESELSTLLLLISAHV